MDPLVSTADLARYAALGLEQEQALLVLNVASGIVRDYCGWHIAPATREVITVDGSGARVQELPSRQVTEVHSVTEDGAVLDVADIEVSADGMLRRALRWTSKFGGVEVDLTHGFDSTPETIVGVVCSVAARASASPTGAIREQAGPFSVMYTQTSLNVAGGFALTDFEQRALSRYVIHPRP